MGLDPCLQADPAQRALCTQAGVGQARPAVTLAWRAAQQESGRQEALQNAEAALGHMHVAYAPGFATACCDFLRPGLAQGSSQQASTVRTPVSSGHVS